MRAAVLTFLFLASGAFASERCKLTSYAASFYGQRTASGDTLRRGALTCAVNRDSLFGRWVWVQVGFLKVRLLANDKFHPDKFALPFLKFDLTPRGYRALGIRRGRWATFLFSEQAPARPKRRKTRQKQGVSKIFQLSSFAY